MTRDRDDKPRKFKYQRSDARAKAVSDRASGTKGGGYDNPFKKGLPVWTAAKDGDYRIRILPATWEGAEDYAKDAFIHYSIGVDNGRFLCPKKMKGEECPVCNEYERAKRKGDDEYAKDLRPTYRSVVWIIDRDNEQDGPQLYPMPMTLDTEIATRSKDKKTGAVLYIDDPDDGYDIAFTRRTIKKRTEYVGVDVDRDPSPVHDNPKKQDRWLQFITDNPIPDTFVFHDEEYIQKVFGGGKQADEDDEDERPSRGRTRTEARSGRRRDEDDEDEDERPSRRSRARDEEDEDEKPTRRRVRDEDEEERPKKRTRAQLDDDDEEDEPPVRKKPKKQEDEDEIDDEDAELDEDEEDEKPVRRKAKSDEDDEEEERPARRKVRDEEDEDDEDEPAPRKRARIQDEDEDEEDEPRPLKKRR